MNRPEPHNSIVMSTVLLDADGSGDCGVVLEAAPGGGYELRWTDFVANEWQEHYDNLGDALARVALLAECAATNWSKGFNADADGHRAAWASFAATAIG